MKDHPVVANAAQALTLGWDPLAYARAEGVDRLFAEAVLREASELYVRNEEAKAGLIAGKIAEILSKAMS